MPNIKLTIIAGGAAAVLIVTILCITALTLNDKAIPAVLLYISGAMITPIAILALSKSD